MAIKTKYEGDADVTLSGTMSGGAASDWIDLPIQPTIYAIHAVCTAGASWQIGNSDKTIVRTLFGPGSSHVGEPSATRAGYIFYEAIPGGGASIRLLHIKFIKCMDCVAKVLL